MPDVAFNQLTLKLRDRFGDRFAVDHIISARSSETIALCCGKPQGRRLFAHYLKFVPQNVRIHIEFETSALRDHDCQYLPQVVDTAYDDDEIILLTEFVDGKSLCEWAGTKPVPVAQAVSIAISLFQCLKELHDNGVEHLDVSPSNLIIPADGPAKLIRSSYFPTRHDSVSLESAFCFSPEQAGALDRDVNAASDLYSAGVMLFRVLTGTYPFLGNSIGDILLAHMTNPVPPLCLIDSSIPAVLGEITEKLLQKDPSARYQTAAAVLHDLRLLSEAINSGDHDPSFSIGLKDRRASIVEPSLVGRSKEMHALKSALSRAKSGSNSLVFLEGDSGSGKSRALGEFSRHAVENGWLLFRGQCIQETSRESMAAMQGVVKGFSKQSRDSEFEKSFIRQFDGEWADLKVHFPSIQSLGQDTHMDTSVSPVNEQRSLRTLSSFVNALGSVDQPALIILDDCQWADDLTLKMLSHWWKSFGDQVQHVMIVVGFRGDEVPGGDPLRRLTPSRHIKLGRLDDDDIRQLAASMAGPLPRRALDLVVAASGGSPFMASAVVRGLVESNAVVQHDGIWEINEREFEACQSSSHAGEFLTRRLELLNMETIELLSAAAALGREFDLDAASHLVSCKTNKAIRSINEARNRNLLWHRISGNRYVFSHDKIRTALLNRVTANKRSSWHRLAAEYLISQPSPKDADIAFHYDAAGSLESALPYAMRAAEDAAKICNFSNAKTQFQIARRALDFATDAQRYAIETGLGWVLMQRGEYEIVESHFEAAARYARNDIETAQALGNLAEIQRRRGDIGDAARFYEESLAILGYHLPTSTMGILTGLVKETFIQIVHTTFPTWCLGRKKRLPNDHERLALKLFSGLSHSHYNGSSGLTVFLTHLYSLNLAEKFLPSRELALLYLEHLGAASMLRLESRVDAYAERSHQIRRDDFPALRDGLTAHYLSVAHFCLAQYDRAIEQSRTAIRMLEQVGDYWKIHMSRYQLAAALYHKGYFREAIEESKRNYESGLDKGDHQASGIILDVWARAKPGDVPADVLQAEFDRRRDDAQGTCQLLVAKTANLIGRGEYDDAISTADEGIRLLFRTGLLNPYPFALLVWGVRALRKKAETLGPFDAAQKKELLRKALWYGRAGWLHSLLQPVDKPRLMRELALINMMLGKPKAARRWLEKSVRLAHHQRAHYDYAESLRRLGQLGMAQNWPNAKSQFAEAVSKLNQLTVEHGVQPVSRDADDSQATLSLADRFDNILDVGRKIASALIESDVHQQTRVAALRLLRSEECVIVGMQSEQFPIIAGPAIPVDPETVRRTITENQTIATSSSNGGSIICAPISVLGETNACLYAKHSMICDMFGSTEKRLADFIATLSGASLENALGYSQLQELNTTLEDRVAERTQAAEARARELAQSNLELERTANDLRLTEEQLRSAVVEANAASEAKTRFLATMSHEIRTPMNGILGMAELALATNLDATQAKYLNVVKQSGQTLLTLLNEILDLSKIEAGKVEIENIEFELRGVVESSVHLFSPAAHEKNLEIICEVNGDLPVQVVGDPTRIRQIIVNLVGNSVKFTSEGEICVAVQCRENDHIEFSIRDTGIGIAPEKQQVIFEAFQQEDGSTTRQYGGTGLGLSICQQLAHLMGGSIHVTSVQGQGSTFSFSLPLESTDSRTQQAQAENHIRGHTLLLISDHASTASASQKLFECLGLHVLTMASVEELESDMVGDFDFIVVDEPTDRKLASLTEQCPTETKLLGMVRPGITIDQAFSTLSKPLSFKEARSIVLDLLNPGSMSASSSSQQRLTKEPNRSSGQRILVADDCDVNQEVARGLLEIEGFEVEVVGTGKEAVDALRATDFDLVLMDVEMPVMDGMEATRHIRKTSNVPIIALSAHSVEDLQLRCEDVGFNEFLSKPFQPDELVAKINHALQHSADS